MEERRREVEESNNDMTYIISICLKYREKIN